jgi:uncharacterized protein (TIGR02996 family)
LILLHIQRRRAEVERREFPDGDLRIGGTGAGGLPLPGLDRHHCTLKSRAVGCLIVDASGSTLVNGKPINGVRSLYKEDVVEIGDCRFMVEHVATTFDPVEQRLVQDIGDGEHSARLVYADWLEENGDTRRAMLLRTQEELLALDPGSTEYRACTQRLIVLATTIDRTWRQNLARGFVHGCDVEGCTMDWGSLAQIEGKPAERRCGQCGHPVRYCELGGEASDNLQRRIRVVIDTAIDFPRRRLGD